MKVKLAYEKSEYSRALNTFMNMLLDEKDRMTAYYRMQKIEQILKTKGDSIQIIITTKNTNTTKSAPPMEGKKG